MHKVDIMLSFDRFIELVEKLIGVKMFVGSIIVAEFEAKLLNDFKIFLLHNA